MSSLNVGSQEIALVKQNNQRRYVKLQVLNRDWRSVAVIQGKLVSCNVSIDGSENVKRTASVSIETEHDYVNTPNGIIDLQRDLPIDSYIKLWAGIEDANTLRVRWYSQGVFIITQSSYNFDPATRTLSMTLADLMTDLNGERGGELHAYTSIVKNKQRCDDVIKNVLELIGINTYSIEPITVLRPVNEPFDENATEDDYYIPYDMNFSVGVTAYEIINKIVGLYPYYEMGFDENGMFYVRKEMLEQDDSYVVINAEDIASLVLSEDVSIDWNYVRNHIEVWGKDGKYYGEADDDNPESPFQVNAIPVRRMVVKDNEYGVDTNAICDQYRDTELAKTLLEEQAKIEEEISTLEALENPTQTEQTKLLSAKQNLANNLSKQQQKFFSTPFRIAQLFLEHSNINLYNSDLKNFAILFNMNKLFEEFIYEKLRNELEGEEIRVESQRSKCLIEGFEHSQLTIDKKKYVRTDILIKKEDRIECIIDTKYKDPKEISSSDIYQMLAYARIYKETKDLHLIYPQYQEQFDKCKAIFCDGIEENDLNLQISTIDLTQDIKKIEIKGLFYKK